jgi:hypothetical protein
MFGLIWIYLHVCKHEHFVPQCLIIHPKPISSKNVLYLSNDMSFPPYMLIWSSGARDSGVHLGDSGGPETPG